MSSFYSPGVNKTLNRDVRMQLKHKILWTFCFLTALVVWYLEFQYAAKPVAAWRFLVGFVLPFSGVPLVHLTAKREKLKSGLLLGTYLYLSLVWAGLALSLQLWVLPVHWFGAFCILIMLAFLTDAAFESWFQLSKRNRKENPDDAKVL